MSKASGLVLILAGGGIAAYAFATSGDDLQEQASRPLQQEVARSTPASVQVAELPTESKPREEPPKPAAAAPAPAAKPVEAAPPPWTPSVTLAQRAAETATRTPVSPAPKAVAIPNDRASLARELQKELRRVGCYDGEINGAWTTSSRRAMKSFTDRVNATLPIEEPDYILLSLVQSHQDIACGKPCPAGQAINSDGRCMPASLMAQGSRKSTQPVAKAPAADRPAPAITGWSTTATAVAPSLPTPPGEGRMALAGPKPDAKPGSPADDRARLAAVPSAPDAAAPRDGVRHNGPVPPVGVYDRRPRYVPPTNRASRASRQNSFARSVFKRMEANNF